MTASSYSLQRLGRYWRHIGGGSLTLSLLIHALLIAFALAWWVAVPEPEVRLGFVPGSGSFAGAQAEAEVRHKVATKERAPLAKSNPTKRKIPVCGDGPSFFMMEDAGDLNDGLIAGSGGRLGEMERQPMQLAESGLGPGNGGSQSGAWVHLPASMGRRCSTAERLQKLKENGGSPACEASVSRSLEWLKVQQNADGSWGTAYPGAMTGLALLCYFGRCETPESPFYGDTTMQGILRLIEMGKGNERGVFSSDPREHAAAYEHGIATYALGEMYTLARLGSKSMPGMREAFEKGVRVILDHQLPDGGWGYGEDFCYRKEGRGDLSVTGWQFQALKAAKLTGLKIAGLHDGIVRTVKFLEEQQTKDGGFGGVARDQGYNQWNLTGCAVLGLQTLGSGKTASIAPGVRFMRELVSTEPLIWDKNANLYAWYYMTQAFFQKGGEDWRAYNEQLLPQLLGNQANDGSWKPERANSAVASSAAAGADAAVYRTALCVLQLEVYYRYLKVADRESRSFFDQ